MLVRASSLLRPLVAAAVATDRTAEASGGSTRSSRTERSTLRAGRVRVATARAELLLAAGAPEAARPLADAAVAGAEAADLPLDAVWALITQGRVLAAAGLRGRRQRALEPRQRRAPLAGSGQDPPLRDQRPDRVEGQVGGLGARHRGVGEWTRRCWGAGGEQQLGARGRHAHPPGAQRRTFGPGLDLVEPPLASAVRSVATAAATSGRSRLDARTSISPIRPRTSAMSRSGSCACRIARSSAVEALTTMDGSRSARSARLVAAAACASPLRPIRQRDRARRSAHPAWRREPCSRAPSSAASASSSAPAGRRSKCRQIARRMRRDASRGSTPRAPDAIARSSSRAAAR